MILTSKSSNENPKEHLSERPKEIPNEALNDQNFSFPSEKRTSCHRCGNIRKSFIACSKCPQIFCSTCEAKMKIEHGVDIFKQGCPLCLGLCCCKNKTINCTKINHCYKKCPVTKRRPSETNPTMLNATGAKKGQQYMEGEAIIQNKKMNYEPLNKRPFDGVDFMGHEHIDKRNSITPLFHNDLPWKKSGASYKHEESPYSGNTPMIGTLRPTFETHESSKPMILPSVKDLLDQLSSKSIIPCSPEVTSNPVENSEEDRRLYIGKEKCTLARVGPIIENNFLDLDPRQVAPIQERLNSRISRQPVTPPSCIINNPSLGSILTNASSSNHNVGAAELCNSDSSIFNSPDDHSSPYNCFEQLNAVSFHSCFSSVLEMNDLAQGKGTKEVKRSEPRITNNMNLIARCSSGIVPSESNRSREANLQICPP